MKHTHFLFHNIVENKIQLCKSSSYNSSHNSAHKHDSSPVPSGNSKQV